MKIPSRIHSFSMQLAGGLLAFAALTHTAAATTQVVSFDRLNESATVVPALNGGDNLVLDTLVTQETGLLTQAIMFTAGGALGITGAAAWEVGPASSTVPRLIGVNIDLFDSSNALVVSDAFTGVLSGFAHSEFAHDLSPGVYKLVVTGTGVNDSSLDVSVNFSTQAPEPATYGMMALGLGVLGVASRRVKRHRT